MTFEDLTELLLSWPHVETSTSYGTPSFKVHGKLLTRLREDGDSLLIKGIEPDERDMLCAADPDLYYYTDHYRNYPMLLIRLSRADAATVSTLLGRTYRHILPRKYRSAVDTSALG